MSLLPPPLSRPSATRPSLTRRRGPGRHLAPGIGPAQVDAACSGCSARSRPIRRSSTRASPRTPSIRSRTTRPGGRTVVDVGGGPGHFTAAFRARGARLLPVRARLRGAAQPRRRPVRRRARRRLLAAGARRQCRRLLLVQRARARARPARPDRRDGPRHQARRARSTCRSRTGTRRGAATRCRPGTTSAPGSPSAATSGGMAARRSTASAPPSSRCTSGRPAAGAIAQRHPHRRRAAALLPALVQGDRADSRGSARSPPGTCC